VGRSTLTPLVDPRDEPDTASTPDPGSIQFPLGSIPPEAVELERVVPASGNLAIRPQQFWLGPDRAGQTVSFWIDTTTVHLSLDGVRFKTLPSRYSVVDLARLGAIGARPAGPPPAPPSAAALSAGAVVELDRTVTGVGLVALGGRFLQIGYPLAGQRVTLRLERDLVHVIAQGRLWRTLPTPIAPEARRRLRGARLAGPPPAPDPGPVRVQRHVSCRGGIQVCNQRVQVGFPHARKIVTVEVEDACFRILDEHESILCVVPRTNTEEVTRFKAYGHRAKQV
jgi:hypothetical protein